MSPDNEQSAIARRADIARNLGVDQPLNWRRRYLKWGGIVAVIIIVVIFVLQLFGNGNSKTIRYKTVEVTHGNFTVTVTATGTLEPVNQVEVGSEISGTIKTVAVDYNDHIKQGQVLAIMDTDQLQARVNQAKAVLELAEAKVKQAQATVIETKNKLRRAKELEKTGMCPAEDCDTAQAAYARAEADLASTRAQVVQAQYSLDAEQTTLGKATIHSPIRGIVLKRDVEPGQTVAASFQTPVLFILAEDLAKMELHVNVDEADVGQVKEGQDAEFTVDAYANRTFPAEITEVHFASQTIEGVVTYETVLRVDNSELLLRPGMTATADITIKQVEDAMLLENAALRFTPPVQETQVKSSGGSLISQLIPRPRNSSSKQNDETKADKKLQQVWVLRDGQAIAIPVSTGSTDGIMTEVIGGDIELGMALIVDIVSSNK